jgi:hypothetical protein
MQILNYLNILIITFITCGNQQVVSPEIESTFNKEQVKDLNKIVEFFTSQMCGDNISFTHCMESSIKDLGEYGIQPILKNINFENQQLLYSQLESDIFNEIWAYCKTIFPDDNQSYKSICYNNKGLYNQYLRKVGQSNPIIKAYHEGLINAGDFIGIVTVESEIYHKTGRINLDDPNVQVILAIEYLSENDSEKRREPWTIK